MKLDITENQFKNILIFIFKIYKIDINSNKESTVFKSSPDYIIEKFERYIGSNSLNKINNSQYDLKYKNHIDEYCNIWKIKF